MLNSIIFKYRGFPSRVRFKIFISVKVVPNPLTTDLLSVTSSPDSFMVIKSSTVSSPAFRTRTASSVSEVAEKLSEISSVPPRSQQPKAPNYHSRTNMEDPKVTTSSEAAVANLLSHVPEISSVSLQDIQSKVTDDTYLMTIMATSIPTNPLEEDSTVAPMSPIPEESQSSKPFISTLPMITLMEENITTPLSPVQFISSTAVQTTSSNLPSTASTDTITGSNSLSITKTRSILDQSEKEILTTTDSSRNMSLADSGTTARTTSFSTFIRLATSSTTEGQSVSLQTEPFLSNFRYEESLTVVQSTTNTPKKNLTDITSSGQTYPSAISSISVQRHTDASTTTKNMQSFLTSTTTSITSSKTTKSPLSLEIIVTTLSPVPEVNTVARTLKETPPVSPLSKISPTEEMITTSSLPVDVFSFITFSSTTVFATSNSLPTTSINTGVTRSTSLSTTVTLSSILIKFETDEPITDPSTRMDTTTPTITSTFSTTRLVSSTTTKVSAVSFNTKVTDEKSAFAKSTTDQTFLQKISISSTATTGKDEVDTSTITFLQMELANSVFSTNTQSTIPLKVLTKGSSLLLTSTLPTPVEDEFARNSPTNAPINFKMSEASRSRPTSTLNMVDFENESSAASTTDINIVDEEGSGQSEAVILNIYEEESFEETTESNIQIIEIQNFLGEVGTSNLSTTPAPLIKLMSLSSVSLTSSASASSVTESPRRRGKELRFTEEDTDTETTTKAVPTLDIKKYSSIEILENSVKLLKKLIMMSASNLGVEELPTFLQDVLNTNFSSKSQLIQKIAPISKARKNFKHMKFSMYYKDLKRKEQIESRVNNNEELKIDLISSLRSQLTRSALADEELKAKANRLPVYHPRRKVNRTMLSNLYRRINKDSKDLRNVELKENLNSELEVALKIQLARLEEDLASKKIGDGLIKEGLDVELSDSLRTQFLSVLRNLSTVSFTLGPKIVAERKATKEELTDALQYQLNSLFRHDKRIVK